MSAPVASPAVSVLASVGDTVTDGPLLVAMAIALAAGTISFFSPCVLPLVPGYLSYVAGLAGATTVASEQPRVTAHGGSDATGSAASTAAPAAPPGARRVRGRMLAGALLFVLGFTVVFVALSLAFGGLGRLLLTYQRPVTIVLGIVTIIFGIAFLGGIPLLARQIRTTRLPRAGLLGAPLLGVVFAIGWVPCIGPTLGAVLNLAATEASASRGALLGITYCLGLGVPFVLTALGAGRMLRLSEVARRHAGTIMKIGGVLLIVIGLLLVSGLWDQLMIWLRAWIGQVGLNETFL